MQGGLLLSILASMALLSLSGTASGQSPASNMSFFVTGVGSGKGADLGGLAGADQICRMRAQAVGAGGT
jgi:hypothetical protein